MSRKPDPQKAPAFVSCSCYEERGERVECQSCYEERQLEAESYTEELDEDQRTPEVRIEKVLAWAGFRSTETNHEAIQKVARAIHDDAYRAGQHSRRRRATNRSSPYQPKKLPRI